MKRLKFVCDTERCIDCGGCMVACKEGHNLPIGVTRRRVITLDQGRPGERSISVSCMHCTDAPCLLVCPAGAISQGDNGIVQVNKTLCIGCGYCFMACPFGAPQFPAGEVAGGRGPMDKCTFCAGGGGEYLRDEEQQLYGQNRRAEGKPPLCAAMCATKALLAGEGEVVAETYGKRVAQRGSGASPWGWACAYGKK